MPLYDFDCLVCKNQFESILSWEEREQKLMPMCPKCKEKKTEIRVSSPKFHRSNQPEVRNEMVRQRAKDLEHKTEYDGKRGSVYSKKGQDFMAKKKGLK